MRGIKVDNWRFEQWMDKLDEESRERIRLDTERIYKEETERVEAGGEEEKGVEVCLNILPG